MFFISACTEEQKQKIKEWIDKGAPRNWGAPGWLQLMHVWINTGSKTLCIFRINVMSSTPVDRRGFQGRTPMWWKLHKRRAQSYRNLLRSRPSYTHPHLWSAEQLHGLGSRAKSPRGPSGAPSYPKLSTEIDNDLQHRSTNSQSNAALADDQRSYRISRKWIQYRSDHSFPLHSQSYRGMLERVH